MNRPSRNESRRPMTTVLSNTRKHRNNGAGLQLFKRADTDLADHYARFGFALLAEALTPDEVAAVNMDALKLCRGDYGAIRYGYEDADLGVDNPVEAAPGTDAEVLRRYLCIHFPHKVSVAARQALSNPRIVDAL